LRLGQAERTGDSRRDSSWELSEDPLELRGEKMSGS